jgi:hypothetical protein
MSTQITTSFVQEFRAVIDHLLQQQGSRLRGAVMTGSYKGRSASVIDQIGAVSLLPRTTRHADTPLLDTPHARRWVTPTTYEGADLIDPPDLRRALLDPQSAYATNFSYAAGRAIDDAIIAAFFGTSATGQDGTGTEAFDTAFEVAAGGAGLTVAKLRAAKTLLMAANVDIDNEQLFVGITANEHDDLLNETQVINLDYNDRPTMVDGRVRSFMGFNFINTQRLQASGGNQWCPCWAKSGMHLGIWEDTVVKIDPRIDKAYSTQVYVRVDIGATRVEQGKVVRILAA